MATRIVPSICGMCTVRCPIVAEVDGDTCVRVMGHPDAPGIKGALCARGGAGIALLEDAERPHGPMIRQGKRGEGKWKQVGWDEAFAYVAEKLNAVRAEYGDRSVLFSDRGGPFRDFYRAWLRAIGTPNYCNHDAACARNVQNAALSMFGFGRKDVAYDLKNCKHLVLQTRNIFEAINVAEVNNALDALDKGGRLTCIDIRASVTAGKADNFFMLRPGTDYAFNLAVIHTILAEELYDKKFTSTWVHGMDELRTFVQPYTPEWAEAETGVSADRIKDFVRQLAEAAPSVIWHPGWMVARYTDSFYVCRTAYIINTLLGAIGAKGGLPYVNKPADVGRKGLQSFMNLFPKPEEKRVDGVGWMEARTHFDAGPGLLHLAYDAVRTGVPYPIKAYIVQRHDPLMAFPDTADLKAMLDNLDLLVSVTFTWSDTAWYSDVVLPMSMYLEREDVIATKNALKPSFFVRKRAVSPRFDTKAVWEIYAGLSRAMGIDKLAYANIEDIWNFQLEGTGVSIEDFGDKGSVSLADEALYRPTTEKTFKTSSGKVEIVSERLAKSGLPWLAPFRSPERPAQGRFRITFGRCGVHTQGHTVNNPLLFEQMPENVLWMNTQAAEKLGIENGDEVIVGSNGRSGSIKAMVTDFIHPEAVFMVHGFGHTLPVESRAKDRGVADNELMPKGIHKWDKAGGCVAMQEHFVAVRKA